MPRWWRIPSWRKLTRRFQCWMRLLAARKAWLAALRNAWSAARGACGPSQGPFQRDRFGSYFQDYLDPGYRTQPEYEESEKPSFENFLSQPTTLADHLAWQLGSLTLGPACTKRQSSSSAIWTRTGTVRQRRRAGGGLWQSQEVPEPAAETVLELLRRGMEVVRQLDRPACAPATCASACCFRLRPKSMSLTSCCKACGGRG